MGIISSLLDTDLYKLTMQQAVWGQFPRAEAEYVFRLRNDGVDLTPYADEIRAEIADLGNLRLTREELAFLMGVRFFKPGYIEALRDFTLEPENVHISTDNGFSLRIIGNWFQTILFEVPVLAIINEVYFRNTRPDAFRRSDEGSDRLRRKIERMDASPVPLRIIEFGTRRRYSREWQTVVVETLKTRAARHLIGTSNVALAMRYDLKPFGTMAHEWLQAGQAYTHPADSQKFALEAWMQEYRGDLGIALSDVITMDAFLRDFDLLFARAYDGARHDSGDPFAWGEKLIAHYERLGIDPRTRTAVFSDSLDIPLCIRLAERFEGRIRTMFGIGTNLTNDLGFPALSIVIKIARCNGRPVVKISDAPGKTLSENPVYLAYLRQAFGLD
ncbi:MAG: nicotinate phosphoribosyltransferase [Capsulimonadales bacterium]|nr:nicotinate phosphoribosyltransferase [Capsulimonadales bacterium]